MHDVADCMRRYPHNPELCMIRHVPNLLSGSRIPASLAIVSIYDRNLPVRSGICLLLVVFVVTTDIPYARSRRLWRREPRYRRLLAGNASAKLFSTSANAWTIGFLLHFTGSNGPHRRCAIPWSGGRRECRHGRPPDRLPALPIPQG
jgi:hypothetical protein